MIRCYWDSCVFIDRIQRTRGRIAVLEEITNAAESRQIELVTSTMAIAEVCQLDLSTDPLGEQAKLIRAYFENDFIVAYQVTKFIAAQAAELVRTTPGLKPPDAIHLATAVHAKVAVLQTFDDKLIALSGRFGNPPLRIAEPILPPGAKKPFGS